MHHDTVDDGTRSNSGRTQPAYNKSSYIECRFQLQVSAVITFTYSAWLMCHPNYLDMSSSGLSIRKALLGCHPHITALSQKPRTRCIVNRVHTTRSIAPLRYNTSYIKIHVPHKSPSNATADRNAHQCRPNSNPTIRRRVRRPARTAR